MLLILLLGIGGRWLAWWLRVPGVLMLLAVGCLAGSVFHWVNADELFGERLQPMVSLAVGFILFEGGMTLKLTEIKTVWRSVIGLLTIGVLVTWVGATLAATTMLGMPLGVALVLGAVLTVTGPTVIGPLLHEIRPAGKAGVVAKWEGIVVDPIGATLAVLVFEGAEAIRSNEYGSATWAAIVGFGATGISGLVVGVLAGWFLVEALRRYWIPDFLRNPVTLLFVALAFVLAELFHHESGLVSVTVMGIWLANQRFVDTHSILEFKETLTVLLISCLFVVLASRVELSQIAELGLGGIGFVVTIIVLVRPAAVWCGTIGSNLNYRERAFLSWFAPRGIVAAAVSAVFALRLGEEGRPIASATFLVILTTVAVYGSTAGLVARHLGLAVANPQGLLLAGANEVARAIAAAVRKAGIDVLLVDSSYEFIAKARAQGLRVHYANILSDYVMEELDLGGLGRFLGLTRNDQVNALAAQRFRGVFGNKDVYQLPLPNARHDRFATNSMERFQGRPLFAGHLNYEEFEKRLKQGDVVKSTKISENFGYREWLQANPGSEPLFVAVSTGALRVLTADRRDTTLTAGEILIYLSKSVKVDDLVNDS